MEHSKSLDIASYFLSDFAPHCHRIEIAGSVRRGKPEVHDIEICAVPMPGHDLFGASSYEQTPLDQCIADLVASGHISSVIKNGQRYKQLALPEGINLDLFLVFEPAQWGVIYTIRTGPADYSRWLVTSKQQGGALPSYLKIKDGAVYNGGKIIPTPEETDFFDLLGVKWAEPYNRKVV